MSQEGSPSYGPILAAYAALSGTLLLVVRRARGGRIPRPRLSDVMLLGLATFKLSRVVTKDKVLQPVREPFVEDAEEADGAEVNSEPAGTGLRRAVGELVTCPFCMSVWIGTGLTALFSLAPRAARLVAAGLAAVVMADSSQYAYAVLRERAS